MKIFAHIRWLYATIVIFLGLALSIILFPIFKAPKSQKIAARFIKALTGFDVEVKGKEDPQTQMFLINHQSDLDIEIMELITQKELAWVAKKSDASKAAYYVLVQHLKKWGYSFVDCQIPTPHLASLGAKEVPRYEFLERLYAVRYEEMTHRWEVDRSIIESIT